MRRAFAGMVLMLGMGAVCADELGDAAKAFNSRAYPQALAMYARLAQAGNSEAALRLGEMHWYGEGAPLDRSKGDALFAAAAAAGNTEAAKAAELSRKRAQHLADISYWTTGYDGADLVAGKFNCVAPEIPAMSSTNKGFAVTGSALNAYTACYNGFIENLESTMPVGKRIPAEISLLMSEAELSQARAHLGKVYGSAAARARLVADQVMAQRENWIAGTTAYMTTQLARALQLQQEYAAQARARAEQMGNTPRFDPPREVAAVARP